MPAPDYDTIFDVEGAIEPAVKAVLEELLADIGGGVKCFTQRSPEKLSANRVEVQLKLGDSRDHLAVVNPTTKQQCRDSWNYTMTLYVVTRRSAPEGPANLSHAKVIARIRCALEYFSGKLNNLELLPYHLIVTVTHQGTDPQVNMGDDLDISEMHYSGVVQVRPGAWPAPQVDTPA